MNSWDNFTECLAAGELVKTAAAQYRNRFYEQNKPLFRHRILNSMFTEA